MKKTSEKQSEDSEHITLFWLDHNITDCSEKYSSMKKALLDLYPAVRIYTNPDLCIKSIKSLNNSRNRLIIIVSDDFASYILSEVHAERSLVAILIFSSDDQKESKFFSDKYEKIISVSSDSTSLLGSIDKTMRRIEKQTLVFNIFDQNKQKATRDLSTESPSFLWHQMLLGVLKEMPQDDLAKEQMLEKCTECYHNNTYELNNIASFRNTYRPRDGD